MRPEPYRTFGDATEALDRLDWRHGTTFDETVRQIVGADLALVKGDRDWEK
mgnify:CR=1 FL=1